MVDADRPAFLEAFGKLAIALRGHEPDAIQMQVYFEDLADLPIELVVDSATEIRRGGAESGWFPTVPDWRRSARAIEARRREEQRARLRAQGEPLCAACRDSGWIVDEATNAARPCACQSIRRDEVLGHRDLPALPPVRPVGDATQLKRVEAMALPVMKTMPGVTNEHREAERRRWRENVRAAIAKKAAEREAQP